MSKLGWKPNIPSPLWVFITCNGRALPLPTIHMRYYLKFQSELYCQTSISKLKCWRHILAKGKHIEFASKLVNSYHFPKWPQNKHHNISFVLLLISNNFPFVKQLYGIISWSHTQSFRLVQKCSLSTNEQSNIPAVCTHVSEICIICTKNRIHHIPWPPGPKNFHINRTMIQTRV
jgi:hypothetical protein